MSLVKPTVGGDAGTWGTELNANLDVLVAGINAEETARAAADTALDGRLDTVEAALPGKASTADITALDARVDTLEAAPSSTSGVSTFNTRTGAVSLTKADVTGTGLAAADVGAATPSDVTTASTADRARTNHTGEQAISTVTGLQSALDAKASQSALDTLTGLAVTSSDVDSIVVLTQAAYDALTPNSRTLYVIEG